MNSRQDLESDMQKLVIDYIHLIFKEELQIYLACGEYISPLKTKHINLTSLLYAESQIYTNSQHLNKLKPSSINCRNI